MRTRRACSALLVLALCGCGENAEREANTVAGPKLVVTVRPKGPDGPAQRHSVSCPGEPGCDAPLQATPPTTACAEIFGGPATATVTGVRDGKPVDAEFSLSNSCEIDRWRKAAALLGDPPPYTP